MARRRKKPGHPWANWLRGHLDRAITGLDKKTVVGAFALFATWFQNNNANHRQDVVMGDALVTSSGRTDSLEVVYRRTIDTLRTQLRAARGSRTVYTTVTPIGPPTPDRSGVVARSFRWLTSPFRRG